MSNILFDLSGKIEQAKTDVLYIVKRIADSLNIPFFVVGASARDFILKHCYGIEPPRRINKLRKGTIEVGKKNIT
jgi:predicted nucleotidyltransferase